LLPTSQNPKKVGLDPTDVYTKAAELELTGKKSKAGSGTPMATRKTLVRRINSKDKLVPPTLAFHHSESRKSDEVTKVRTDLEASNDFLDPTGVYSTFHQEPSWMWPSWPFGHGSTAYGYLESFFRTDLDFIHWEQEYLQQKGELPTKLSPFDQDCLLPDLAESAADSDYVMGCNLPALTEMAVHPDIPLLCAKGSKVVRDTSRPLQTLDFYVETSLKFNLLLAELPLVMVKADIFNSDQRDVIFALESESQELQAQSTDVKLRVNKASKDLELSSRMSMWSGTEVSAFCVRLNNWVEHLGRRYVLLGRRIEEIVRLQLTPFGVRRHQLTPYTTPSIVRKCLTEPKGNPRGVGDKVKSSSNACILATYLGKYYNGVISPEITDKVRQALEQIKEKCHFPDIEGLLNCFKWGVEIKTRLESISGMFGHDLEWDDTYSAIGSDVTTHSPTTGSPAPPAFFKLLTDRQIRRFVQLDDNNPTHQ